VQRPSEFQHRIGPVDMPVDGVLIGKHLASESLTNNDHGVVFALAVEVVEITACDNGDAQSGKESRGDDAHLGTGISVGDVNMSVRGELKTEAVVAPGCNHAECSLFHVG